MIRFFDIFFSFFGLLILLPFLFLISLLIKVTSKGPIIYKQQRVGQHGKEFYLFKFRSMKINADKDGLLTVGNKDTRITLIGYYLRKFKLDELPQLFNVLFGQMSLVGPRPEVRKYVLLYNKEQKRILNIKPGITDWASIKYKNENNILGLSKDPEFDYINNIIPDKIGYNLIFLENYNIKEYFKIVFVTLWSIFK